MEAVIRRRKLDMVSSGEDNLTVRDLLITLGMDMDEPWNAGLNGTMADPSDKLSEGSLLVVFPPMAGG